MNKTLIIAEAGVNHNGSFEMAKRLIDVAVEAHADAIKFQTFKTEEIASETAPKADYQVINADCNETQYQMLKKLELSYNEQITLKKYCEQKQIQFLSTPFDLPSLAFLTQTINIPIIKIASGEITNAALLLKAAKTGKPIILSTGMSTLAEIEMALSVLAFGFVSRVGSDIEHEQKNNELTLNNFRQVYHSLAGQEALKQKVSLLHCVSDYPAPMNEVNLKALDTMRAAFQLPVGYSDHTLGTHIAIAACARGACIIEKHFTLDRSLRGPDHAASLEPHELISMVKAIRDVEAALGNGIKIPTKGEIANRTIVRKGLISTKKIAKGERFTEINLGLKRPFQGVCAMRYWDYLGKYAEKDYAAGEWILELEAGSVRK